LFSRPFLLKLLFCSFIVLCFAVISSAQVPPNPLGPRRPGDPLPPNNGIPKKSTEPILRIDHVSTTLYMKLAKLEDERFYDATEINRILQTRHLGVRKRAALAIGRIGDRRATPVLMDMFVGEQDPALRATVAFSLGVMNDPAGLLVLLASITNDQEPLLVKERSAEALGKILSAPDNQDALDPAQEKRAIDGLLKLLPDPTKSFKPEEKELASLVITALLRIRNEGSVPYLVGYLKCKDDDLRWQAANALSRMRAAAAPAADALLAGLTDPSPLVQIYCVRALASIKEKRSVDPLLKMLATVSATGVTRDFTEDTRRMLQIEIVKALGQLGDKSAGPAIAKVAEAAYKVWRDESCFADCAPNKGESPAIMLLLESAQALGILKEESALPLLKQIRFTPNRRSSRLGTYPEFEIAVARFGEQAFFDIPPKTVFPPNDWQSMANYVQGLAIVGGDRAHSELLDLLNGKSYGVPPDPRAVAEILTALVRIKADDAQAILRQNLESNYLHVRAVAAGQLGNFDSQINFDALKKAYDRARSDEVNDAKLAALNAIAKYKNPGTIEVLISALTDNDYNVRRDAIKLLAKVNSEKYDQYLGIIQKAHSTAFYDKVRDQFNSDIFATIVTKKGEIKIALNTREAPMTAENFIELANRGFYNGLSFMRVVPNFVIQGGDPNNNSSGGPGYQIRDEINMLPCLRGSVGMALSGRDTGGSQFFICHLPQPHLDGGYTVFGRVVSGMDVVDRITRGDVIERIEIEVKP